MFQLESELDHTPLSPLLLVVYLEVVRAVEGGDLAAQANFRASLPSSYGYY